MNKKLYSLLLAATIANPMMCAQYAWSTDRDHSVVVVNNGIDAYTAAMLNDRLQHQRTYPAKSSSIQTIRELYERNNIFYKLPVVREQLDYLLDAFADEVKDLEAKIAESRSAEFRNRRYNRGLFSAGLGISGLVGCAACFLSKQSVGNDTLVAIGITSVAALAISMVQFTLPTHGLEQRLAKDQEIYALLKKEKDESVIHNLEPAIKLIQGFAQAIK